MANNINCTCGHSWSKASSSKKDMYVCHMCGKDNTMKDGGWLDNYGKKPNPNDVTVSTGPGFVGMGNDTTGRNYSPAWGGQFQMGGSLPGAVGFTYARTAGSAPSNGKYAKKTKASAQDGKGLGSSKQPTYLTFDTNDPAFQSTEANDFSIFDRNNFENVKKNLTDYMSSPLYLDRLSKSIPNKNAANKAQQDRLKNVENLKLNLGENTNYYKGVVNLGYYDPNDNAAIVHEMSHGAAPTWYGNKNEFLDNVIHSVFQKNQDLRNKELSKLNIPLSSEYISDIESTYANSNYKPFQDEHYRPKDKSKTQQQVAANETYGDLNAIRQLLFENKVTDKFGQELTPDIWNKALEDRKILNNPLLKRMKLKFSDEDIIKMNNEVAKNNSMIPIDRAQNGKEMKFYQEGLDFKPNSIAQDGAIVDPMGQWAHPGEVTIIPSTDITMEGVDYPVLGISDTGDQQMMYPGEDYQFDGEYVTEYPMMKEGGWLSKYQDGGGGLSRSNLAMMATLTKDIKNQKARNAQETVSQYTPKPGDQQRMNAAKDAYRAEEAKPLNKLANNPNVEAAAKNLPGAVEFALDVMTAGEATAALNAVAKPLIKSIGKQVATKIEKIAAAKAAKRVFEPAEQEAMDEWYRVAMLPKTTNQENIDVLNAFKERIKTPEGKRRLKQLGISDTKDLQKLNVYDEPNTYGVYYGGFNKIGVHPKLDATSSKNIVRHEIEHGVQRAYVDSELQRLALKEWPWNAKKIQAARENLANNETTNVDKLLGDLELRRTPTTDKVWDSSIRSEPIADPSDLPEHLSDRQRATDYFSTGSEGKEKAPFVAELQQYMLDKGYINHPYEYISPEKVKEVMGEAYFDKVYPLRIFQIMKNTDKNHKLVSDALNKLLAVPPIVAGGAAALTDSKQKENGGWLTKYK